MEMDWNFKTLGQPFQVVMQCVQNPPPKNIMASAPLWNVFDISFITLQEYFVYG